MSDYRVTVKVQNNNILRRINEAGYDSVSAFGKSHGIDDGAIGAFINMKAQVFNKNGDYRVTVKKIAAALKCLPEDLFTEKQLEANLKSNVKTYEVSEQDLRFMLESQIPNQEPEKLVFEDEKNKKVRGLLEMLTPREAKVIKLRFGIDGADHTLEQIAKMFGVTAQLIRIIEAKALRKLRHPGRSSGMVELLEGVL